MPELHNQMYCPNCAVGQYGENADLCYNFEIRTNVTEKGTLEVSCSRCGEGAIYMTTYLKTTHGPGWEEDVAETRTRETLR